MGEPLSTFVSLLKYTAIALAAAFGVLALLVDYKDKSGHVTRWGRIAIVGVIGSGVISVATQALESFQAEIDARASARIATDNQQQTALALKQMERLLQPLTPLEVTLVWEFPAQITGAEAYLSRVAEVGRRLERNHTVGPDPSTGAVVNEASNDTPLRFALVPNSPFYPRDPETSTLLLHTGARVSIFDSDKSAATARAAIVRGDISSPSALGYFGSTGDFSFGMVDAMQLGYSIPESHFFVVLGGPRSQDLVRKNGKVVSIPDLQAATILISVDNLVPVSPDFEAARKLMKPSFIRIQANGHVYTFQEHEIASVATKSGYSVFTIRPADAKPEATPVIMREPPADVGPR